MELEENCCKPQSFYIDSRACVQVGNDVSEWLRVNVRLRQGCAMSPWVFNVYMDGVVREVNVRVLEIGLVLLSTNGGRFEINQLLQMIQHWWLTRIRSCVDW